MNIWEINQKARIRVKNLENKHGVGSGFWVDFFFFFL